MKCGADEDPSSALAKQEIKCPICLEKRASLAALKYHLKQKHNKTNKKGLFVFQIMNQIWLKTRIE